MEPSYENIFEEVKVEIIDSHCATRPAKRKRKNTFKGQKREVVKHIRNFPCLWNHRHKHYRNVLKRNAAWDSVAQTMNISVAEARALWKKARDAHRYLTRKARNFPKAKSGQAAPEEDDEEEEEEEQYVQELREEMAFLDDNTAYRHLQTASLGGDDHDTATSRSVSPAPFEFQESNCDIASNHASTSSNPSCMPNKSKRERDDSSMEAALLVSRSIDSFIEKREDKTQELKHKYIWLQLEKLFEQLDEDKIIDLNFQFISQTYSAIVEKREREKKGR
ncbi:uncharacterized protein LOC128743825 [Sabethes cyaneus]|uniref:uncharacterized protein LOC128743825 n=1 Tax=Sabethes cyaneus TaxID=53552 RepID=UPI00237D70A3|nr:uncharacterized protein LOC128743825 [Sabethes cyaneus]